MENLVTTGKPYRRTSDNMWCINVNYPTRGDGRRNRTVAYGKTRNKAIKNAQDKAAKLRKGIITTRSTTTLDTWLDHWVNEIAPNQDRRPSTVRNYRSRINNNLKPIIGAYKLDKFTAAHVRELHTALYKRGLSESTMKLAHTALDLALEDAVNDGIIEKNVASIVGSPRGDAVEAGTGLSVDEARHLIRTSIDAEDPFAYRWATALLIGARQGEVIGLTEDRVNFDHKLLDLSLALVDAKFRHGCNPDNPLDPVCGKRKHACPAAEPDVNRGYRHKVLHRALILAPPKTKERVVPMIPVLEAALRVQLAGRTTNRHGLVWPNPRTGEPIHPGVDYKNWQLALKRAGLPPIKLHAARHTTATLLQSMGVPEDVRMKILGHSSATSHRSYAHVDSSLTSAALVGLGDVLFGSSLPSVGGGDVLSV